MSRIRGLAAKVQKPTSDVFKPQRNGLLGSEVNVDYDESMLLKEDAESFQIRELLLKLPQLDKILELHRKIGEGTFSSVYLGTLRQHSALPDHQKRWFAIKHLVPTAHPARIEHELRCLRDMGGKHNVIGVDLCLRHLDTVVFVMPYIPHRKFSEYVGDMDAGELRDYMRALVAALQHVHSFGVIHRDVKPSNFLYDRENRRYQLVDFGLAQRVVSAPGGGTKRPREQDEELPASKRAALDLRVAVRVPTAHITNEHTLLPLATRAPAGPAPPGRAPPAAPGRAPPAASGRAPPAAPCQCGGRGSVCAPCARRPPARAARAGTQGFRPPEVLLKVRRQGPGVDMWAAGVVLAMCLCARYPLLRAPDDARALAELAHLLGPRLAAAARAMGRRLVMSVQPGGVCLRRLAARLRGASPASPAPAACAACACAGAVCLCPDPNVPPTSFTPGVTVCGFPDSAFALAGALLEPDPARRPGAAAALAHPFLRGG